MYSNQSSHLLTTVVTINIGRIIYAFYAQVITWCAFEEDVTIVLMRTIFNAANMSCSIIIHYKIVNKK